MDVLPGTAGDDAFVEPMPGQLHERVRKATIRWAVNTMRTGGIDRGYLALSELLSASG